MLNLKPYKDLSLLQQETIKKIINLIGLEVFMPEGFIEAPIGGVAIDARPIFKYTPFKTRIRFELLVRWEDFGGTCWVHQDNLLDSSGCKVSLKTKKTEYKTCQKQI